MSCVTHCSHPKLGCQTQKSNTVEPCAARSGVGQGSPPRGSGPARIVEAAARLIYERGVAGTTLDDVKASERVADVLLLPDKDELVQTVIRYQADVIAVHKRQPDLGSAVGQRAWRARMIAQARSGKGLRRPLVRVVTGRLIHGRRRPPRPPGQDALEQRRPVGALTLAFPSPACCHAHHPRPSRPGQQDLTNRTPDARGAARKPAVRASPAAAGERGRAGRWRP
jgi:hypothetical protein